MKMPNSDVNARQNAGDEGHISDDGARHVFSVPEHNESGVMREANESPRPVETVLVHIDPQGAVPQHRQARVQTLQPSDQLAALLTDLVDPEAAPSDTNECPAFAAPQRIELNFRKAVEALAANSLAAQISDLACYARYCEGRGGTKLPADEARVVGYIDHLEALRLKPATITRRLASLAAAHGYLGVPSPTRTPVVSHALRGMRKRLGVAQSQALGLRFGEGIGLVAAKGLTLSAMLEACEGDPQGLRDAALLSLGYDAGLRVSELIAVTLEDLEPQDDGTAILHITTSKTDQEGEGTYVWVSPESLRRVRAWVAAAGIKAGSLFRRVAVIRRKAVKARRALMIGDLAPGAKVDRAKMAAIPARMADIHYTIGEGALTRQGVALIYPRVARRAADLGLVDLYGAKLDEAISALTTHSLRVGLTQDLFAAGEEAGPVTQALRWRNTTTALRYARKLAPQTNAAARVLGRVRV